MDKSIYATSVVGKYLETAAIKETSNFHQTKLPHDIIFIKEYASTNDEKVQVFYREYIIHYIDSVGFFLPFFNRVDCCAG